eukprot:438872-Rhodomonas_salina.1
MNTSEYIAAYPSPVPAWQYRCKTGAWSGAVRTCEAGGGRAGGGRIVQGRGRCETRCYIASHML